MRIQHPPAHLPEARNRRPVVIVHGTLVEKESIEPYKDFALENGHPVDHRTYPNVKDGGYIQESARMVAENVNASRAELAAENLSDLESAGRDGWKQFFHIDGNLYGKPDPVADKVLDEVPWLLKQVKRAIKNPDQLSSRLEKVEHQLAERIASPQAEKIAAELVDSVAPKAMLIGHSAGGFVAYTLAVNPEEYDGGKGVAEVVLLSSPVRKGMPEPLPPAMADMAFYVADKQILRPLEETPAMQLAQLNPFFALSYGMAKTATKTAWAVASQMNTGLQLPAIYAMKPGYEQVTGGSEFFEKYVKDKPIPQGVSVISVTSDVDRMVEPQRAELDESQPNAHNLKVDQQISPEELERERPTWAHVKMSERPDLFLEQFQENLRENPEQAVRHLHPDNGDGIRYEVLKVLAQEKSLPEDVLEAVRQVAAERLPFADSPSALAQKILDRR